MSHTRVVVSMALCIMFVMVVVSVAAADVDPRIAKLLEKAKAHLESIESVYADETVEIKVNGQTQQKFGQRIWVRDLENIKLERDDGTAILLTPNEVSIFEGRSQVLLHIPQETLEALGDERDKALAAFGLTDRAAALAALEESGEHMTIEDEIVIGDELCWLISVGEEAFPAWRRTLSSIPAEFKITALRIAMGQETAIVRGLNTMMTGPAQLEILVNVWEFETEVEVSDDILSFEPPEDATVLEWTPDKTAEEMLAEFRQKVTAALQG